MAHGAPYVPRSTQTQTRTYTHRRQYMGARRTTPLYPNCNFAQSKSSLCRHSGDVEATAYVIIALGRSLALEKSAELANATHETTEAISKGLDYVIARHKGRSGWGSTRDTLYAAWALAETVRTERARQSHARAHKSDPSAERGGVVATG